MRKFIPISTIATAPPPLSPSTTLPSPLSDYNGIGMVLFPAIPIADSAFDIATLSLISCLTLLSVLSLCFIFHLRLKSRISHHLQNFISLWSVRLLLVSFAAAWALNEILRLPFFHRHYLYPFLPNFTLSQQSNLCKIHIVLSLGLFEPGFLITLLFLLNVSIKKRTPRDISAISLIFFSCTPVLVLQLFFLFFSPLQNQLPNILQTSSILLIDSFDNKILRCTYPIFSTIVFAAFVMAYTLGLLFSYWRVVSLVINKSTRVRIHALAFSVLICLPLQILFLASSSFWRPGTAAYGGVMFGMFISVAVCVAVGESVLVIRPIADALAAGGEYCRWKDKVCVRAEVGRREAVDRDL
ncbi:hypothetical protein Acr_18g0005600 [Actinidia rufa]|uniref:Uncharacterized protein n=1 Tax=Actinidia rufa TaxID=165716 RepID=A0A7J0G6H5_9ERIC|nr:hypothetical protein Acr_18g0005600 [Actinidia rufa]